MGVEGGMKCVKYLLFFFNFIFWLCGLALIIVGVVVQVSLHKTFMIQDASASGAPIVLIGVGVAGIGPLCGLALIIVGVVVQVSLHKTFMIQDASASGAPIVLIGVGVLIFFIAFFGCCGAFKENYCMVTTFAVLLSLIIIAEVAAAITGYVFRNKLSGIVQDSLTEMINSYKNGTTEFKASVDNLQEGWKCCGVNSTADWKNFSPDGMTVPDSCCVNVTKSCGKGAMTDKEKVYQRGCHDVLEAVLKKNIQWVIVAALVIAFLQIMGIVFACLLMRAIRSGYEIM